MSDLDYLETLIHEQACDELEWTIKDVSYRILFASPVYRRVCMELMDDVFCRLTGNLDADL
jgi:hypothetical protein